MPELPEVETTCRGITPHIIGQTIHSVVIRQPKLRWPISPGIKRLLPGQRINQVSRRGKYLLLQTAIGTVIIHLGMSGSLRIVGQNDVAEKHDHVDFVFGKNRILRFRDPRRFGAVLWTSRSPYRHKLLSSLGPEPLDDGFNADVLFSISRNRKIAIKPFIMDSKIVVGVGNIYANEALFQAGIRPTTPAGRISLARYQRLVTAIKTTLSEAIEAGGTTLRDFTNGEGKPGYFRQKLQVYGRAGENCTSCGTRIKLIQQAQRATYYCTHCQR